jgi:bacterioferritin-associated ferredoxin
MYVCLCTGATTQAVEEAIARGAKSTKEIAADCGAGSVCGRCRLTVRRMLAVAPKPEPARPAERLRRRWGRDRAE